VTPVLDPPTADDEGAELMARRRALIGEELRRDRPDEDLINALICEP
jgi:hypothetical protein